jgi:hypothetical protein
VAAGYGITPYGIGDWGSENSFVPGVGALSIQSQPPIVQTGIIPSGGAVLIGSAPVVIVIERVKTPGTGVLGFVGELPQLRIDFFATGYQQQTMQLLRVTHQVLRFLLYLALEQ